MSRLMLVPALALGAALAAGGPAAAADFTPTQSGIGGGTTGGTTMTLGGKGTVAQAAASTEDTEETWYHRRGYYRGFYNGYNRGYYGGWGGYGYASYGFYRPYYRSFAYAPAFYSSYYVSPYYDPCACYYGGFSVGYGGFGGGFVVGIDGKNDDVSAPAVTLGLASKNAAGTFRYDGGPAIPVPQPKPEATPSTRATTAPAVGLPVSLKKEAKPASPYTYKAYGEK